MGRKSRTALLLMCCMTLDIRANSLVMMMLSIYHGPNITWGALHIKPGCPQTSLAYGLIDGSNPDFLDFSPQQLVQDLQLTQSLAEDFSGRLQGPYMFSARSLLWSLYITFLVNILSAHKPLGRWHRASALPAGVHITPFFYLRG